MFLQFLIAVLLAVHLVCMNVSSAGPLLCLWLERHRKKDPDLGLRVGQDLLRASLVFFFVGALLGLVMAGVLWLSGNTEFFDVLKIFGSRVFWGVWELVFFVACVFWQLKLWKKTSRASVIGRCFLGVLASTNLMYHFPPLFTAMAEYAGTDFDSTYRLTSADYRGLIFNTRTMSISMHFWLASIAVTGAWLMFKYRKLESKWPVQMGARFALLATAFQMAVGLWVVISLPNVRQDLVMGGNMIATSTLAVSLGLSVFLLNKLTAVALGQPEPKDTVKATHTMMLIVGLMSFTLWFSK